MALPSGTVQRELGVLALLAGLCAYGLPRVLLPTGAAPRAPRRAAEVTAPVEAPEDPRAVPPGAVEAPMVAHGVGPAGDAPEGRGPVHAVGGAPPGAPVLAQRGMPRRVVPAPQAVDEVLHRTGDRWVVDLRRLGEPRAALSGARLAPVADPAGGEDAPGRGFVVSAMDRRGLLARAGIRPGDVLVEVNGAPTLTPDQALDAWSRNQHGRSFAFRFQRGGSGYTVRVEVLNAPPERPPLGLAAAGSRGS
ncbi:MAG: hypothetical protein HY909_26995 [Deltaproteobacteria bacterium]|nr:hypothetical protein [Deltaproteobacteria bacterium]